MKRLTRLIFIILIGIVLIAAFSMLFSPVRHAAFTTLFLADFLAGEDPSLFKLLTSPPTVLTDTLSLENGLQVPFDFYLPSTGEPAPAILFSHGLAHQGNRDPRLRAQSLRLARAGFAVMAPDLVQMKTYRLGFQDVEAVVGSLDHLGGHPAIDPTRIGVIAPSFGAGPILIAISRPEIRDRVHFGLIFGGYFDLERTLAYTLTGAFDAEGHTGRIDPSSDRHSRWKFLRGNAHLLPASSSQGRFLEFLEAKRQNPRLDIRSSLAEFSPIEQQMLVFMDNENPALFDSLYATIPVPVHDWIEAFSLRHYAPDIPTRLLIVHSRRDATVHFTESLALHRSLPNACPPLVIDLFTHVDLKLDWSSFRTVREELLPGLGQLWSLASQLLHYRN